MALLAGCGAGRRDARLEAAERLMESRPDSALAILEGMGAGVPEGEEERALYGLLLTQALDKNHLPTDNDSLITLSAEYYRTHGDMARYALACHYQGRVREHAGDYSGAVRSYYQAKETASSQGLYLTAGLASRGISDIFSETYNSAQAEEFAREAYAYTARSHRQPYVDYSLYDLAGAYHNNRKYKETIELTDELADSAEKRGDIYLLQEALRLRVKSLIALDRYREALDISRRLIEMPGAAAADSLYLAWALAETGMPEQALSLAALTDASGEEQLKGYVDYAAYRRAGRLEEALRAKEHTDTMENRYWEATKTLTLTSSLADYFKLRREVDRLKVEEARMISWMIALGALIILIMAGGAIFYIRARQKRIINEKMAFAEQLREELAGSEEKNTRSAQLIQTLTASRFNLFQELSQIIWESTNRSLARRKIADRVTGLVEDLSIGNDKVEELGREADALYSNIYSDFRRALPGLKEADYRLFLFTILGMTGATIALLLKVDRVETVYSRRRHLKDRIKLLPEPERGRYMSRL